jgi:hypothetical protein
MRPLANVDEISRLNHAQIRQPPEPPT